MCFFAPITSAVRCCANNQPTPLHWGVSYFTYSKQEVGEETGEVGERGGGARVRMDFINGRLGSVVNKKVVKWAAK